MGVLTGRGHLGRILARTGRLDEALALAVDTIARVERSRGDAHPDCVYGVWRLALLYVRRGERGRAGRDV